MKAIEIDKDRLSELRETFRDGPLTIKDWAAAAGIAPSTLTPGYRGRLTPETVAVVVSGAARLLHVERSRLSLWLSGQADPGLTHYLRELRALAVCSLCGDQVPRGDGSAFDPNLSLCIPCRSRKGRERYAARAEIDYGDLLVANLTKIKAKSPGLSVAITVAAKDRTRAVTYARLASLSGLDTDEVKLILSDLDLLKPRKPRRSVDQGQPASGGG